MATIFQNHLQKGKKHCKKGRISYTFQSGRRLQNILIDNLIQTEILYTIKNTVNMECLVWLAGGTGWWRKAQPRIAFL